MLKLVLGTLITIKNFFKIKLMKNKKYFWEFKSYVVNSFNRQAMKAIAKSKQFKEVGNDA